VPALATAAALVGAAGGAALASRDSRKRLLGLSIPSKGGARAVSKDLAEVAKSIGSFGEGMGSLATEVRRVGEAVSDSDRDSSRSPIEIVLQGLTRRR
jgi:hypothetical protein